MLIKVQHTTLLQIFCEFKIHYIIISLSILGQDDSFQEDQQALMNTESPGSRVFLKIIYQ